VLSYGIEYDFGISFFDQFRKLMLAVPRRNLYQDFAVNSEYTNHSVYMHNSYMCFGGRNYENCRFCAQNFDMKDCIDVDFSSKCEYCYDSIHIKRSSQLFFSSYSENCVNSLFLYGCRNCSDCIGCTNLRNKSHCIFNKQYSREEYETIKDSLKIDTVEGLQHIAQEFYKHSLQFPRKYAWVRNIDNSTGDDLEQVRNCTYCFSATDDENCKYSFFMPTGTKDTYDVDHVGMGTTETYELHSGFGDNRVFFSNRVYFSHDIYYSDDCYNCEYLIGCISLRKKSYCIFNKQYTKEEYNILAPQILKQMKEVVYVEEGKVYAFGEFFPKSIIPFSYNETVAQEYFPLMKNEAIEKGYLWKDDPKRNYVITLHQKDIPPVATITEDITEEVIECSDNGNCNHQCTTAFKVTSQELLFYKRFNLPIPTKCPNCRHFERISKMNLPELYHRSCMKEACGNEFETPYMPGRPEIIYCESCYQQEVA
jgi:hypothetical protein